MPSRAHSAHSCTIGSNTCWAGPAPPTPYLLFVVHHLVCPQLLLHPFNVGRSRHPHHIKPQRLAQLNSHVADTWGQKHQQQQQQQQQQLMVADINFRKGKAVSTVCPETSQSPPCSAHRSAPCIAWLTHSYCDVTYRLPQLTQPTAAIPHLLMPPAPAAAAPGVAEPP